MATDRRAKRSRPAVTRRHFLQAIPAVTAGSLATTTLQKESSRHFGSDAIHCAEQIDGVTFSPNEEELIVQNVNRFRDYIEALRAITIPPEIDPFAFHLEAPRPAPTTARAFRAPRSRARTERPAPEDLPFLPVTAQARLLESRQVSSEELTTMYLERLKRLDPSLQCVVTLSESLAMDQARAADAEIRTGRYRGVLHGIPWGVKDLFATKGIRTTWGAKPFENQIFDFDATVVDRLRSSGAVLLAKLTSGELAIGDLWFGGKTRNPWNPALGSKGSSAGPAAATAAGLVGFGVGTETNGSIVSPAATCGLVGLRPTFGRVSRHGVMSLRWSFDKIGPLCRSVEDCAVVLGAIHGRDGYDRVVIDSPFAWDRREARLQLRIGYVAGEFDDVPADATDDDRKRWPDRKPVLAGALEIFRTLGMTLEPVELPQLPADAIYALLSAEAGAAFDELTRSGRVAELAGKGPTDRANQLRSARFIPAVEYVQAQRVRTMLFREVQRMFATLDAFVTPPESASVTMTNLTGHPAITLNAGFAGGLPQGIMITGRLFEEHSILSLALSFERARGTQNERPIIR